MALFESSPDSSLQFGDWSAALQLKDGTHYGFESGEYPDVIDRQDCRSHVPCVGQREFV
jgi:hypothetical protein